MGFSKYEGFAQKYLNVVNVSGSECMVRCIFHDDTNASMQFNIENGLYICFGCGEKGSIKTLERELGIRAREDEVDIADITARLDTLMRPGKPILPVRDESYLQRFRFPTDRWGHHSPLCEEGCKYHRGFDPATIASFDLGYDPMGDAIGPYLTIPIRNVRGGLLGVIKRYTDPDAELKYRYPTGFHRSENLFASWLAAEDPNAHTVVFTEGAIDAMKVWQAGFPALAIYGSSMSQAQYMLVRRLGITQAVFFFDNDKAGWKAVRSCLGIKEHKRSRIVRGRKVRVTEEEYNPAFDLSRICQVTVARYQKEGPTDPGGMVKREIRRAVQTSREIDLAKLRGKPYASKR